MAKVYNNQPIIMSSGSVKTPVDKGPIYEGKYRVRYFDTDGTILKIEYVESGGKTTPPDAPSYDPDYLIFAEWNYDTDNYIVEQPTDIGAIYDTVDNVTYMFCRFTTNTGLNPTLKITGATSIDWGDGTVDTNTSHTYVNEGEYIIKIYGDINFTTTSSTYLLGSTFLNKALRKCYIKNGVTSISDYVFNNCYSLTSVTIPGSVTTINQRAFFYSESLAFITIPDSVTRIRGYAFYYCASLTSVTIPGSVTTIEGYAFCNCTGLTSVTIPGSVTTIGVNIFDDCCGLKNVTFSGILTSISNNAFTSCTSLESITIPESVTIIGSSAFSGCLSLKNTTIPKNVINIGSYAFSTCESVNNYFIECDTVPTLSNTNAFNNINRSAIMWVNDSIIEQLKVATNWSTYASYMKPLSWYPSLTDPNA